MIIAFTPVLKYFSVQPPMQRSELVNILLTPWPLIKLLSE